MSVYILKKDKDGLHIYETRKDRANNRWTEEQWMCSIDCNHQIDWNDQLMPTIDDMKYIIDIDAHFDKWMKDAPGDTFNPCF